MAQLDPLGIDMRPVPVELDPALYGFTDKDLDREYVPLSLPPTPPLAMPPSVYATWIIMRMHCDMHACGLGVFTGCIRPCSCVGQFVHDVLCIRVP